jgi:RNA polymerase sigma factor (sigma-70 family)
MAEAPPIRGRGLPQVINAGGTRANSAERHRTTDVYDAECAYQAWPDGALAAAVVRRHEDAYAELVRRHSASVGAAIRMLLGAGPSSDDVLAEVFAEFWFAAASFDPSRGSLPTFLRMRARSHGMDLLRSESSRRRREEDDLLAGRDVAATIDSDLLASEMATVLRNAVTLLPPTEREVIQLAYFDGMTYRAVALHLDVAEGTVKSRIRTALRRLRVSGDAGGLFAMSA